MPHINYSWFFSVRFAGIKVVFPGKYFNRECRCKSGTVSAAVNLMIKIARMPLSIMEGKAAVGGSQKTCLY